MRDLTSLFDALGRSKFRSRFRLNAKDLEYFQQKGMELVLEHAEKFIRERLASAYPKNDGRQTPMRGHPAFVAQHATATCCRGCLSKWHRIPSERELSEEQIQYVVTVLRQWLQAASQENSMGGEQYGDR